MFVTGQLETLICDAINIIVDKKVKVANYNTTILVELISDNCLGRQVNKMGANNKVKKVIPSESCYKARRQDAVFYVYPLDEKTEYHKGDKVLVLVPNNDMRNHKIILRKQPKGELE